MATLRYNSEHISALPLIIYLLPYLGTILHHLFQYMDPGFGSAALSFAIDHVITGYEARGYGLQGSQLETEIELDLNGG